MTNRELWNPRSQNRDLGHPMLVVVLDPYPKHSEMLVF
jgi:hypothetical protein